MEDSAVEAAYRTYGGPVYARCLGILRNGEAARDVTQEVFLRCFDHRASLRPGPELLSWLYRVATNLCLNALRDREFRRKADQEAAPSPIVGAQGPSRRAVLDLLRALDERTQAIVVYVYLDGMTHAEAAAMAFVSDRTVRNCLARFLEHARELFDGNPGPYLEEGCG